MQTKIRYKPAANGYETIYLDTCFRGKRKYEMLGFKVKLILKHAKKGVIVRKRRKRQEKKRIASI